MPVRVNLLKHTANETLERTTGEQDSGLEPKDPNKRLLKEPSLLPKAMINKRFQYVLSLNAKIAVRNIHNTNVRLSLTNIKHLKNVFETL